MYLDNGYLDFDFIDDLGATYTIIIGGRGIGKTYGCLQHMLHKRQPFLFLRRTQAQIDIISNPVFNPFRAVLADDMDKAIIKPISKTKSTTLKIDDELICINAALSTFASMRGWSGEGIDYIVYDEFIPSPGERPIKDEGEAFLHCYETINRNREISGSDPVKVYLLANAFDITADILRVLGVTREIEKMIRTGKEYTIIDRSGVKIALLLPKSPISEKKAETSIYKVADERFKKVSLKNSDGSLTDVITRKPLKEYRLIVSNDDFCVYRHKSKKEYYVTGLIEKSKNHYTDTAREKAKFKIKYNSIYLHYLSGSVFFDSRLRERLFVLWLTGK